MIIDLVVTHVHTQTYTHTHTQTDTDTNTSTQIHTYNTVYIITQTDTLCLPAKTNEKLVRTISTSVSFLFEGGRVFTASSSESALASMSNCNRSLCWDTNTCKYTQCMINSERQIDKRDKDSNRQTNRQRMRKLTKERSSLT